MKKSMVIGSLFILLAISTFVVSFGHKHTFQPSPPVSFEDQAPIALTQNHIELKSLTWTEVRAALKQGYKTVIIPTAGIEQGGPHVVLGKHGYVLSKTAPAIARHLGKTLLAPTIYYVPEGNISPPSGHMKYPGTISLPPKLFEQLLRATAASLKQHGFTQIIFLGDSGGNQQSQDIVARQLNQIWNQEKVYVLNAKDYYFKNGQTNWLQERGFSKREIGTHVGIKDTSEMLASFPQGVRLDRIYAAENSFMNDSGMIGDPTKATKELGVKMLQLKVDAAVRQIKAFRQQISSP